MRNALTMMLVLGAAGCAPTLGTFPVFSTSTITAPADAPTAVRVAVDFAGEGYEIQAENRTDATVIFRWDLASFISSDGVSGFLLPGTTRVIELNQAPRSEPIPPSGTLLRVAVPVWEGNVTDPAGIRPGLSCDEVIGRPIRLTLPIETGGTVHEYVASFEVESFVTKYVQRGVVRTQTCPDGG